MRTKPIQARAPIHNPSILHELPQLERSPNRSPQAQTRLPQSSQSARPYGCRTLSPRPVSSAGRTKQLQEGESARHRNRRTTSEISPDTATRVCRRSEHLQICTIEGDANSKMRRQHQPALPKARCVSMIPQLHENGIATQDDQSKSVLCGRTTPTLCTPSNSWFSMSYWEKTVSRIFDMDERIRYVGIVDMQYHVVASKMRPGISSLTPTEVDWNFVSIVPRTMLDSAQKLESKCGPFQIMTIRYRKVMIAIYRGEHHIVMLSFDSSVETPFLRKLTEELGRVRV